MKVLSPPLAARYQLCSIGIIEEAIPLNRLCVNVCRDARTGRGEEEEEGKGERKEGRERQRGW